MWTYIKKLGQDMTGIGEIKDNKLTSDLFCSIKNIKKTHIFCLDKKVYPSCTCWAKTYIDRMISPVCNVYCFPLIKEIFL